MLRLQRELEAWGIRTWLGRPPGRVQMRRVRTVIKSPGLRADAAILTRARAAGAQVLDELELGWRLAGAPVIGVTGTNGKSTVAGLLNGILRAAGRRVELAGNVDWGPPLSAVGAQADSIVCEVSSFQLEGCVELLPEVGVLTNLSPEHLGRHKTMERYGEMKRRMFIRADGSAVPCAVIGVDDDFGSLLAAELELYGTEVIRVGRSPESDYRIERTVWTLRRSAVELSTPWGELKLDIALPGPHNASNAALAVAAADAVGVDRLVSVAAICGFAGVAGRFEHVDHGQPFDVIVDYAHTPDGLEQFLGAVRDAMHPGGRLFTVLSGAAPSGTALQLMGAIGRRLSDELVLTVGGGRQPLPPLPAVGALLQGSRAARGARVEVVLDRRRALQQAVRCATAHDVVAIVGRGALKELAFDRRGRSITFDDRIELAELLGDFKRRDPSPSLVSQAV